MSTSKKLDEITELVILLQNSWQGITIDEMKEKLERPRRAIERLMEVIREKFGDRLEIVKHNDNKKHWRLKKGCLNYLITFSDLELSRLKKLSDSIQNETERKCILNIIEKIKALNPAYNHKTDIDTLLESQGYAVRQYTKENIDSEIMEKIAFAIQSEQKLKISYTDRYGNFYEPIIEPYGLKIGDKHYLIAGEGRNIEGKEHFDNEDSYYSQFKIFKLSRIEKIEILEGEYYYKDKDFDIQEYCERSFNIYTNKVEEFVIEFLPVVAGYVSHYHFHPSQKGYWKNDSYILTFKASGYYEIITELLKWREGVNIIKPLKLKKEYEETVRLMYENIMKG